MNSGGSSIVAISDLTQLLGGGESLGWGFGMPEQPILPLRFLTAQQTDSGRFDWGYICLRHTFNLMGPPHPVNTECSRIGTAQRRFMKVET